MELKKIKNELYKEIKQDLDKDVKIVILEFTEKQDSKNDSLFASKEIENIVKWIVRITTGSLVAGTLAVVISRIIKLI